MSKILELILNIVYSALTFLKGFNTKKETDRAILIGLAHRAIIEDCKYYIQRGWLTHEEYEDLHDRLYEPYRKSGGNGSGERLMNIVNTLPIREYGWEKDDENHKNKEA